LQVKEHQVIDQNHGFVTARKSGMQQVVRKNTNASFFRSSTDGSIGFSGCHLPAVQQQTGHKPWNIVDRQRGSNEARCLARVMNHQSGHSMLQTPVETVACCVSMAVL
jgi:hypothetical protein